MQFAIENAINYDKCHSKKGEDKLACLLDKATVNIGTLFSKQVEGRVSTEVSLTVIWPTAGNLAEPQCCCMPENKLQVRC